MIEAAGESANVFKLVEANSVGRSSMGWQCPRIHEWFDNVFDGTGWTDT
jgi:hypothetical protein